MAYRSRKEQVRVEAASEGLVADMVRQFADPFAFVRELVQNGIDAGASALTLRAESRDGVALFSVHDDGCGMTRETIEGPLLTLFSSSKDDELGKIGKYGVGFVSVFSVGPELVTVETWREEGGFHLALLPDHTYQLELADRPRASASGTVVSLKKALAPEAFRAHADEMCRAAERWCRHAHLPIHFVRVEAGKAAVEARIDRPLEVAAVHAVRAELDGMTIVAGPSGGTPAGIGVEDAESFAGFYCHGLTLFEASAAPAPALVGIRFKVDSPRLAHTLSRDNVRHDEAYRAALRRVEELCRGELVRQVRERLAAAASAGAPEHPALLVAACTPALGLGADELALPLAAPLGAARSATAASLVHGGTLLVATRPGPVASALAAEGRGAWLAPESVDVVDGVARRLPCAALPVEQGFILVEPIADDGLREGERALLAELAQVLDAAGHAPPALGLARVRASGPLRAGYGVPALTPTLLPAGPASGPWRGRLSLRALALANAHPAVQRAARRAASDARGAAALLGRYLLSEELGELSKAASDRLLAAASET